jgi:serine/threonine-protein kinase
MGPSSRIADLLLRWEEGQQQGRDLSAAELCAGCPELADELGRRIRALRALDSLLDSEARGPTSGCAPGGPLPPPARPPSVPGYEVLGELGRGGMGVVYKARQVRADRLVALKMILSSRHASPEDKARFQVEAEAIARLQHPHVVPLYEVGEHDGLPFFSLELCPGGSLDKKLAGTPLPPREAAALVQQLARAMQAAHAKGVVHRDLKPANVLLAEDGTPKVTDFGLAKKLDRQGQTATGHALGTPSYMAPEQASGQGKDAGPAADVYALGAILYECLTGRPPFKAPTPLETLEQVKHQEPVPPRHFQPKLARDLETICLKCLHKESGRRYPSAAALADDLGCFLEGRPISARPAGRAERLWRWGRRKPKDAALLAAAGLIVGLTVGGSLLVAFERATRAEERLARLEAQDRITRARSHYLRGDILSEVDRVEEAVAAYRQAIELVPDDPDYHYVLGNLFYNHDRFDEAIAASGEAVRLNPHHVLAQNNLGEALEKKGRTAEAILAYREAIRLKPDYAEAHNNLGDTLRAKGELGAAIASYREAVRLKPAEAGYHNNLGNALRAKGELGPALAAYREAIRLKSDNALYHNNLGIALRAKGELGPALASHREAIRLKRNEASYHHNLGAALYAKGEWNAAIASYREAIRRKPDFALAHHNLGLALREKGELEAAIASHREAVRLKPTEDSYHHNLGVALRAKGELEAAIASYREAIRLKRDFALAHNNLGNALRAKGELGPAIAAYCEAVRLKPGDAVYHSNLGAALSDKGDREAAIAAYRQAICLKPDFALAYCNLGLALRRQGLLADGLEALRKGHQLGAKDSQWSERSAKWVRDTEQVVKLEPTLPALLRREVKPADAAQRAAYARLCYYKSFHAEATRLYAEAFVAEPALAKDLSAAHSYYAACAAALAASRQGRDAAGLDPEERRQLRAQALGWLRLNLALRADLLKHTAPPARAEVLEAVSHWLRDPDLAGLREPAALADLPEAERQAWRDLWADVAALLKRAQGKGGRLPSPGPHGAGVEEVARPQGEAGPLHAHARPVLGARQVVQVQHVPQHHVGPVDRLVVEVARQDGAQRPGVLGVFVGVVPRHPQLGLGELFAGGAAVGAVAAGDQLVGARQPQGVLRGQAQHAPRAEVLGAGRPGRLLRQPRPTVLARRAARLVLPVVELLDRVVVGAVDVEVEAVVDVVDVRRGEQPALAHQRAVRRRPPLAGVLERAGQADLRRQAAVVAEVPAADVVVAAQVVGAPQHQRLAVGPPEVADVGQAGRLLVHHHHALALGLALGVPGQAADRRRHAVLAGDQFDQARADAAAEVVRARRAAVVRHEDLGQAGVLQDRAAAEGDVFEDQPVARVDRPAELPAFPADLPALLDDQRPGRRLLGLGHGRRREPAEGQ